MYAKFAAKKLTLLKCDYSFTFKLLDLLILDSKINGKIPSGKLKQIKFKITYEPLKMQYRLQPIPQVQT